MRVKTAKRDANLPSTVEAFLYFFFSIGHNRSTYHTEDSVHAGVGLEFLRLRGKRRIEKSVSLTNVVFFFFFFFFVFVVYQVEETETHWTELTAINLVAGRLISQASRVA